MMMNRWIGAAVLAAALTDLGGWGSARVAWAAEEERQPEPAVAKQAEAEKLIKDVYKDDFAKRGPDERRALAKRMLEDAKTTKDPATQFVLLQQAREIGAALADIDLSLAACGELGQRFVVDGPDLKLKALVTIKPAIKSPEANQAGGEAAMSLTDEAVAMDEFDVASKALDQAIVFATAAKNIQLASEANARKTDVRTQSTAFFEYKVGLERLKSDPADLAAKFHVGSYLALYRNDWDKGLALTAECSDTAWSQAAKADLAAPVSPTDMLKVADAWYDLGANRETVRGRIWVRAEFWYNLLLPNVEGVQKVRAEKRLEQIAQVKPLLQGNLSEATKKALPTGAELKKLRDLCVASKTGSVKTVAEMKAFMNTLLQRLNQGLMEGKEADFFARCKAELQIRKVLDQNGCGSFNAGGGMYNNFPNFGGAARNKEELAARLLALDRFNQQEKIIDAKAYDQMIASTVRQYVTNNAAALATLKQKLDLVAYLKNRSVPAKGLDAYRTSLGPAAKPAG